MGINRIMWDDMSTAKQNTMNYANFKKKQIVNHFERQKIQRTKGQNRQIYNQGVEKCLE